MLTWKVLTMSTNEKDTQYCLKKCDSNYKTKLCIENEEAGENANSLVTLPKGNLALPIMNVSTLEPRSSIYPR